MSGKVSCATVGFQVVIGGEARAEEHHVGGRRNRSTVMARSGELPGGLLSGKRMGSHLLLASVQIEGPGLGDDPIFNNDRPVPVIGILRPKLFSGKG